MKIKFLLLGTSLSFIPILSHAQCVETTNCETLGYTETSCNGGKGVKCPFGNKWACLGVNEEVCMKIACEKLDFKYSCTGTGYLGGIGKTCNGKYTQCTCTSDYEWKDGNCQKKEILNGADGDVYKCNGKVVAVKAPGMSFYVAMKDLGYMDWNSADRSCSSYSFCSNIKGVLSTFDQLKIIYNNKSSLNSLLSANGGTKLTEHWYWSSTLYSNGYHYFVHMSDGHIGYDWYDTSNLYVRPILTSW